MAVFLLGFDWADVKHDVCIMSEAGEVLDIFTFPHGQTGMAAMRERVQAVLPADSQLLCALETNQGLLVSFLLDQGWTVYPINPKSVDRYRERTRTAKVKSDSLDAWLLADILRTDRHLHRPLRHNSEQVQELRELTRDRGSLVQESTRLGNKLQAALKAYWPESLTLFDDVHRIWVVDFLTEFPTHEDAAKASLEMLRSFLKQHRYPQWKAKAEEIYTLLRQPHLQAAAHLVRTKSRHMKHLAAQLKTTLIDIRAYDREIERLLREHPDGQLFLSLPGAGSNLAARLLAEIGDAKDRYATANSLQCDAGTAPVTQKSGKSLWVVAFRYACRKPLRQALQLFAGCSLTRCPWARALYAAQRAKGKQHQEAIRIVANRWVKIIFAMWKNGTLYDEARYLAAKERFEARSPAA